MEQRANARLINIEVIRTFTLEPSLNSGFLETVPEGA
jgi:hypothetical protein